MKKENLCSYNGKHVKKSFKDTQKTTTSNRKIKLSHRTDGK